MKILDKIILITNVFIISACSVAEKGDNLIEENTEFRIYLEDKGKYSPDAELYAIQGLAADVKYTENEFFSIRRKLVSFCEKIDRKAILDNGFFVDKFVVNQELDNSVRTMACVNKDLVHPQDIVFYAVYIRPTSILRFDFYRSGFVNADEYEMVTLNFADMFVESLGKSLEGN